MNVPHSAPKDFDHVTSSSLRAYLEGEMDAEGDDLADLLSRSDTLLGAMNFPDQRRALNQAAADEYNDGREHRVRAWLQKAHDKNLDPADPILQDLHD